MNITKNGLYDNYPIYFVQQLKKAGRRDMAMAFMDYWDDYRSGDGVEAIAYYAKCWHSSYKSRGKVTIGMSHTTAKLWIEEFEGVIGNFEASWELFEKNVKSVADRSAKKSIDNQSTTKEQKKSNKRPDTTDYRKNQSTSNKQSIDTNNKTNNNKGKERFEVEDLELSKELFTHIKALVPNMKTPNLNEWANECYWMRVKDNRSIEQIMNMMKYVYTDDNVFGAWDSTFFKGLILDMKSFRKQYDSMSLKIKISLEKYNG